MIAFLWESAVEAEGKQLASPRKRRQLREKGQVVSTPLLAKGAALLWLSAVIAGGLAVGLQFLSTMAKRCFSFALTAGVSDPVGNIRPLDCVAGLVGECGQAVAALLCVCLLVPLIAFVCGSVQIGLTWSGKSFAPDDGDGDSSLVDTFFQEAQPGQALRAAGTLVGFCFVFIAIIVQFDLLSVAGQARFIGQAVETSLTSIATIGQWCLFSAFTVVLVGAAADYVLRRRRFEVAHAMGADEVRREQIEDAGRPEVRQERLDRALALLDGGALDVVLLDGVGGGVILGRQQGRGTPRIASRLAPGTALMMTGALHERGVRTSYEPLLTMALSNCSVGHAIPGDLVDEVAAVYRRLEIGTTAAGKETT